MARKYAAGVPIPRISAIEIAFVFSVTRNASRATSLQPVDRLRNPDLPEDRDDRQGQEDYGDRDREQEQRAEALPAGRLSLLTGGRSLPA